MFESRVLSTGVRAYFRQDLACAMCLSEEAPGKPPEASGKTYGYGLRRLTESVRKEPEAAGRPRPGGLRQAPEAFSRPTVALGRPQRIYALHVSRKKTAT